MHFGLLNLFLNQMSNKSEKYMRLTELLRETDEIEFAITPGNTNIQPDIIPQPVLATENPVDIISMDVPLFIRLLEWAYEDAESDIQLHDIAEKITALSGGKQTLSMDNYTDIISATVHTNKLS